MELMIVMIIIGLLVAVSVPVLFSQVGKARESELLVTMGAMARAQQAYHVVNGTFALTLTDLENEMGTISVKYYDVDHITGDSTKVKMQGVPLDGNKDQVRNYAFGVYFQNGLFNRVTCQGELVGSNVQVGDLPTDPCSDNGRKL